MSKLEVWWGFALKYQSFESWLNDTFKTSSGEAMAPRAIASRLANCRRVERYEGDLDDHAEGDRGALLKRLTYSTDDASLKRPPRHSVPIDGDVRHGTATLKTAVNLYFKFVDWNPTARQEQHAPQPRIATTPRRPRAGEWPTWSQPSEQEALALAQVVCRYVRFLAPAIIDAVVCDNERQRGHWVDGLIRRGIDPNAYLWQRSPCAFPGVRRYAGSQEIAEFRKKATALDKAMKGALRLDDNDYPKQIWSFVFRGRKFPKHGPVGYSLAHLADHKIHGNRFETDFELTGLERTDLFGLYTSVTNAAYIPSSMIKPTDFGPKLRNLLVRRAAHLYSGHCRLLPDWLKIRAEPSADWHLDAFDWAQPVGEESGVQAFLDFRGAEMEKLLGSVHENVQS